MKLLKLENGQLTQTQANQLSEISFHDWMLEQSVRAQAVAVVIKNDEDVFALGQEIQSVSTIILEFPTFKDGRAFTQARLLRERAGFRGEIRARGHFLPDQIAFMVRCGFDAFEVAHTRIKEALQLPAFTYQYQSPANGAAPIWRRRFARAAAA